jgi:hypothetical protein
LALRTCWGRNEQIDKDLCQGVRCGSYIIYSSMTKQISEHDEMPDYRMSVIFFGYVTNHDYCDGGEKQECIRLCRTADRVHVLPSLHRSLPSSYCLQPTRACSLCSYVRTAKSYLFELLIHFCHLPQPRKYLGMRFASLARLPVSVLVTSLVLATSAVPVQSEELLVLGANDFDSSISKGVWYVNSR